MINTKVFSRILTHGSLMSIISMKLHTCYFVSYKLTGLYLTNAPEKTLEFLLGHVLRKVVDY